MEFHKGARFLHKNSTNSYGYFTTELSRGSMGIRRKKITDRRREKIKELLGQYSPREVHKHLSDTRDQVSLSTIYNIRRQKTTRVEGIEASQGMVTEAAIEQKPYKETSHKQKMRELSEAVINEICLPWIGASFIVELKPPLIIVEDHRGHRLCPPIRITKEGKMEVEVSIRDTEGIPLFQQALRGHLKTGGFSEVLSNIELWRQGLADNLLKCHNLLNLVRTELEQVYDTSIPTRDLGQSGFTMDFPITVCADAVEQAKGSRHFADFPYLLESLNLKFGAFTIYIGSPGEDLKPYEDKHRTLRTKYATHQVTKEIADQREELDSIASAVGQALLKFQNMERLPGYCELCS